VRKIRSLVSVRGRDVYVACSLYGDSGESVNDRLCRLLFFVAALRDAGAGRLTIVAPYLYY
jgi:ribose-phosphate pyrophosphokinase